MTPFIRAKVDEAMQFVGKLADALAVANVGKVGVAVQVAHDYGTGPHGEAMTLKGRHDSTRKEEDVARDEEAELSVRARE